MSEPSDPIWIHAWIDSGTLSRDDDFSPELADEDCVLDADRAHLWDAYETARAALTAAATAIVDVLRDPSAEERATRRAHLVEVNRVHEERYAAWVAREQGR